MRLNETAKATLREAGVSQAEWARANGYSDGKWGGDVCGCTDTGRCANGFHHDGTDDCGCLPTMLNEYLNPVGWHAFDVTRAQAAIVRPNGEVYRPRKLAASPVTDEDEITVGVVVFGTHDPGRAKPLADDLVHRDVGRAYAAVDPGTVWWRDGFNSGQRAWVTDEEHGRAGVFFREIVETSFDG